MRGLLPGRAADRWRLLLLALRQVAGRRFWILPALPLLWLAFQIIRVPVGWRSTSYGEADVQGLLIGTPLAVLGAALGVRIIAGEIDQRTLEIAYTVPGGAHRVWVAKLAAATGLLIVTEALLAAATYVFATSLTAGALYGALQGAVFYMVLAMSAGTLFKSEATGALVTLALGVGNVLIQANEWRISPFWNPAALDGFDPADVLAWTAQNRIGYALAVGALALLSFGRAERRESMLGG
jgi:hypothetical protein